MKSVNKTDLGIHFFYWTAFMVFFTLVWGIYDQEYGRNFMIQMFSLPSRLLLVYGTLFYLVPRFLKKEEYLTFFIGFFALLLICTVVVQRAIMVFIVEDTYLPYHSSNYFQLSELMNTAIDVGIATLIPFSYHFVSLWQKSNRQLKELAERSGQIESDHNFIVVKEGNVNHKILLEDILYVESLRNYLKFKTTSKELISYGSITSIQDQLNTPSFLRVQRSFIININHLDTFTTRHLSIDGRKISIGRKYKEEVISVLQD